MPELGAYSVVHILTWLSIGILGIPRSFLAQQQKAPPSCQTPLQSSVSIPTSRDKSCRGDTGLSLSFNCSRRVFVRFRVVEIISGSTMPGLLTITPELSAFADSASACACASGCGCGLDKPLIQNTAALLSNVQGPQFVGYMPEYSLDIVLHLTCMRWPADRALTQHECHSLHRYAPSSSS